MSSFTCSGRFPARIGRMVSRSKMAFVSTTASAGRLPICIPVLGIFTLLTTRSRPQSALIRRMPSSPVGFSSTSSSPFRSLLLFSSRCSKSSLRHFTLVRANFHFATVPGSFRYSFPGINSARWRSPAAAIKPKRLNKSNFTLCAQAKHALAQLVSRSA